VYYGVWHVVGETRKIPSRKCAKKNGIQLDRIFSPGMKVFMYVDVDHEMVCIWDIEPV